LVERAVRTVRRYLEAHFTQQNGNKSWDQGVLDSIVRSINSTPHTVTKIAPEVLLNTDLTTDQGRSLAQQAVDRMRKQADKMRAKHDRLMGPPVLAKSARAAPASTVITRRHFGCGSETKVKIEPIVVKTSPPSAIAECTPPASSEQLKSILESVQAATTVAMQAVEAVTRAAESVHAGVAKRMCPPCGLTKVKDPKAKLQAGAIVRMPHPDLEKAWKGNNFRKSALPQWTKTLYEVVKTNGTGDRVWVKKKAKKLLTAEEEEKEATKQGAKEKSEQQPVPKKKQKKPLLVVNPARLQLVPDSSVAIPRKPAAKRREPWERRGGKWRAGKPALVERREAAAAAAAPQAAAAAADQAAAAAAAVDREAAKGPKPQGPAAAVTAPAPSAPTAGSSGKKRGETAKQPAKAKAAKPAEAEPEGGPRRRTAKKQFSQLANY
jgi:hypothetical protein